MSKFSERARKATTLSPLMVDREKISTDDVISKYKGHVTLMEFDILPWTDDNGQPTAFPVFTIAENPDVFLFGGAILKAIADMWAADYGGDIETASREVKESGGCKVTLEYGKTKKGRRITTVTVED